MLKITLNKFILFTIIIIVLLVYQLLQRNTKTKIASSDINYFSICLKEIINYPYPSQGKPHLCCSKPFWNDEIRFSSDHVVNGSIIIDFGANEGGDSMVFLKSYEPIKMHLIEPIPTLAKVLEKKFRDEIQINRVVIHNSAIGQKSKKVRMIYDGQGSSISKDGNVTVVQNTFAELKDLIDMDKEIALVNINCEGCEWNLLEEMIINNVIPRIKVLQFATHVDISNFKIDTSDLYKRRYCRIRDRISRTHKISHDSVFWAWERWILRDVSLE